MNKVWLVTGSASGLDRSIAEAVLESGDRLVATARDTKRLDDLAQKCGDRVRAGCQSHPPFSQSVIEFGVQGKRCLRPGDCEGQAGRRHRGMLRRGIPYAAADAVAPMRPKTATNTGTCR
jgi:NAD(P)-dependent dehydrogenase (short-subunit alcohol dehydrogenase family)